MTTGLERAAVTRLNLPSLRFGADDSGKVEASDRNGGHGRLFGELGKTASYVLPYVRVCHPIKTRLQMTSSYDRIINLLSTLSRSDVKRLELVVSELVNTGYMPAHGHVEYRFITRSGKRYGPYKYRRLWQNGKLKDICEGKADQDEYQGWLTQKAKRKKRGFASARELP
jgi:hypothetical protein